MIDQRDEPEEGFQHANEQEARLRSMLFLAAALDEADKDFEGNPIPSNPEAALAFLLEVVCERSPEKLHKVIRLAWAIHAACPEINRWGCIQRAARVIK